MGQAGGNGKINFGEIYNRMMENFIILSPDGLGSSLNT